ncbi:hypothetical protein Poly41_56500 [Novipirellula artificiosorum]|uniref:Uncharacterized protein n=1 Tax=Novipirellula artificiosorum TaxID=2528016 RepID=A0A5C6D7X6_9BACT|nr:hypothetical protein Poly41_56500 [Novipirellula artificiosorum]
MEYAEGDLRSDEAIRKSYQLPASKRFTDGKVIAGNARSWMIFFEKGSEPHGLQNPLIKIMQNGTETTIPFGWVAKSSSCTVVMMFTEMTLQKRQACRMTLR